MNYSIEIYTLDLINGRFVLQDIIEDYVGSLNYFDRLNGVGTAKFTLNAFSPKANTNNLIRYRNQVVIKRGEEIVWVGPIVKITGKVEGVNAYYDVECDSYFGHLKDRYTQKLLSFTTPTDASQIAWNLINYTQTQINGDLLIDVGSLATSTNKTRNYELMSIGEAVMNLSEVLGGIDFELQPIVDGSKRLSSFRFNTYYPKLGSLRTDIPKLKYGENLLAFSFITSGSIYNYVYTEGSGTGNPPTVVKTNLPSMQAYSRREYINSAKDISEYPTLNLITDSFLNKNAVDNYLFEFKLDPSMAPFYGEYNLGDTLLMDVSMPNTNSLFNFKDKEARVVELAVEYTEEGVENISPKVTIVG